MKKAFTLIELLIVVAIIAILAAIAVPNFLEAQVRAKISRQKSDMRTMTTALETYRIDHNKLIPDNQGAWLNMTYMGTILDRLGTAHFNHMLTTPIAYLTTVDTPDSFAPPGAAIHDRTLRYVNFKGYYTELTNNAAVYANYARYAGEYQIMSQGPNRKADPTDPAVGAFWVVIPYDATNGTVSPGDIVRTQKNPEGYTY